eukprot:tig00020876_g14851.t1
MRPPAIGIWPDVDFSIRHQYGDAMMAYALLYACSEGDLFAALALALFGAKWGVNVTELSYTAPQLLACRLRDLDDVKPDHVPSKLVSMLETALEALWEAEQLGPVRVSRFNANRFALDVLYAAERAGRQNKPLLPPPFLAELEAAASGRPSKCPADVAAALLGALLAHRPTRAALSSAACPADITFDITAGITDIVVKADIRDRQQRALHNFLAQAAAPELLECLADGNRLSRSRDDVLVHAFLVNLYRAHRQSFTVKSPEREFARPELETLGPSAVDGLLALLEDFRRPRCRQRVKAVLLSLAKIPAINFEAPAVGEALLDAVTRAAGGPQAELLPAEALQDPEGSALAVLLQVILRAGIPGVRAFAATERGRQRTKPLLPLSILFHLRDAASGRGQTSKCPADLAAALLDALSVHVPTRVAPLFAFVPPVISELHRLAELSALANEQGLLQDQLPDAIEQMLLQNPELQLLDVRYPQVQLSGAWALDQLEGALASLHLDSGDGLETALRRAGVVDLALRLAFGNKDLEAALLAIGGPNPQADPALPTPALSAAPSSI